MSKKKIQQKNVTTNSPTSTLNRLTDLIGLTSSQENTDQLTPASKPSKSSDTNSEPKKASSRKTPYSRPISTPNTKKQKQSHVTDMETDDDDTQSYTTTEENKEDPDLETDQDPDMETDQHPNLETDFTPVPNTQSKNYTLHESTSELHHNLSTSIHNPDIINNQFSAISKWETITSTKRYRAWISEQALPEKETKDNIKFINLKFQHMASFIRSKSVTYNKIKYICLEFSSMKALNNALEIEINDTHITNISPIPPTTTKPETTVALRDVPIGTTEEQVQATMAKFGNIVKIKQKIITKWLYTTVEYETEDQAKTAINEWSTLLGTDRIRILPLLDQPTILEQRDAYTTKLVNLPYGTTAYELEDMIQSINGKSCYIPRSPVHYNRQRFAIIAFKNETDLAAAMNRNFTLRNNKLQWENIETRSCRICFSTNHVTRKCTYKNKKAHQYQQLNKLYENREVNYRKPIITSPTLNYKKALLNNIEHNQTSSNSNTTVKKKENPPIIQRPWNIQNTTSPPNETTQQKNKTNQSDEIHSFTTNTKYTDEISKLKNDLLAFNQRLNLINSKIDRLENKLDTLIKIVNNQNTTSAPTMPIFNTQSFDSKLKDPIPLQTRNTLEKTLIEKENEILELKQTNLDLTNQLTSMNSEQQSLIYRMEQIEKHYNHELTQ